MDQKIELNIEKDFGKRISTVFLFLKQNGKEMAKGMPYYILAYFIITLLEEILENSFGISTNRYSQFTGESTTYSATLNLLIQMANLVVTILIGLYITNYISDYNDSPNGKTYPSAISNRTKIFSGGAIGGYFIIGIATGIGLMLCILPGLLVLAFFSLFLPTYVENRKKDKEEHESVFSILRESYELIKYDFLKSIGFLVVIWLMMMVAIFAVTFLAGAISELSTVFLPDAGHLLSFINLVTNVLISLLALIAIYVYYTALSVLFFDTKGEDEYAVLKDKIDDIGQDDDNNGLQ